MDFWLAHPEHGYLLLLGAALAPRLTIAVLALAYWPTNPWLVVMAWVVCFAGGSEESNTRTKARKCRGECQ